MLPENALQRGAALLRGTRKFDEAVIDTFVKHLDAAPEEALFRMNPIRYARTHRIDERIAVDLFLHATHAGLLEFNWGLLCPYCYGFLTTPGALRSLRRSRACTLCECEVTTVDDSLEIAFTVAPAIRRIRFHSPETLDFATDGMRSIFSPSLMLPEVLQEAASQSVLTTAHAAPGEVAVLEAELAEGNYRIAVPAEHAWLHLSAGRDGPSTLEVDVADGQIAPYRAQVRAGPVQIRMRNRTRHPLVMGLARALDGALFRDQRRLDPYLSGKRMVTTQAFRDLFRSESIPSEGGLEFKSLTVLFTDLKGSTELYERIGDFRAYQLVREHFDMLRRVIDQCGGSMVKTIGDAIMASFAEVEPAVVAATRMRSDIFGVGEGELSLKVGLHTGPCIAVELNEQLDYFGQTVNLAARVQGLANGGEIVCTDPVWSAPGVQEQVRRAGLHGARDRAHLKGLEEDVTVYRLGASA